MIKALNSLLIACLGEVSNLQTLQRLQLQVDCPLEKANRQWLSSTH